jgi:hypothetical protein
MQTPRPMERTHGKTHRKNPIFCTGKPMGRGLGVKHHDGTQLTSVQGVVFATNCACTYARRTLTCVFSAARLCPNHPLKHGFRGHN